MSDENTDEQELNVGEYQAYRRKVIGQDDEGNLIFGPKEPIEEDEEGNDGGLDSVIDALDGLTDEELQKVQREVMKELYGFCGGIGWVRMDDPIDDFESDGLGDYSGNTDTFTTDSDPVVLPGDVVKKHDGTGTYERLTGDAYENLDEDGPHHPGSYD